MIHILPPVADCHTSARSVMALYQTPSAQAPASAGNFRPIWTHIAAETLRHTAYTRPLHRVSLGPRRSSVWYCAKHGIVLFGAANISQAWYCASDAAESKLGGPIKRCRTFETMFKTILRAGAVSLAYPRYFRQRPSQCRTPYFLVTSCNPLHAHGKG